MGVAFEAPPYRRAKIAIRVIKEFTTRHMKASEISIKEEVNLKVWARGMKHPPRRIRLEMERDEDGLVSVSLAPESE